MFENPDHNVVYPVPSETSKVAHIKSFEEYKKLYNYSVEQPNEFWKEQALKHLHWDKEFYNVQEGSLEDGDVRWFVGGKLNASVNCLDKHIANGLGDKVAVIWEPDDPNQQSLSFTYKEVLQKVCEVANVLRLHGVKKHSAVTVYLPMTPQILFTMLACTRIGAAHSVVFAGFSPEALRCRIVDVNSEFVVTSSHGFRGGRTFGLARCVHDALDHEDCAFVKKVFLFTDSRSGALQGMDQWMKSGKIVRMEPEIEKVRPYCPPESMDSEDILFYLYTSGSTGNPKGLAHTTAGYLLYTKLTHLYLFDIHTPHTKKIFGADKSAASDEVFACVADCGWITGHSYIVYGPLQNGTTTVLFESTPTYPTPSRYWQLVDKHKVTQFYTAPTAIRALMKFGPEPIAKYDLSTLKVLGTVGEPINPEAWKFYHTYVGRSNVPIVDTYWQTETGGIVLSPFPGAIPTKPGSACVPFFGIVPKIFPKQSEAQEKENDNGELSGVLCIEKVWPGLARTVNGDHGRYVQTYLTEHKGCYFTGDGATCDKDGYFWITGRVDDVLNISGHRVGSAEIESALVATPGDLVAEAAVVGIAHAVKGQAICCYVILKQFGKVSSPNSNLEELEGEVKILLRDQVRKVIGPFASPDVIVILKALPKTRSGKIMRRILRKLAENVNIPDSELGDVSTLAESEVLEEIRDKLKRSLAEMKK